MIWFLIPLAILRGILGRMGGAGRSGQWYDRILDTKWRDVGCALTIVADLVIILGWYSSFWWVYLLIFILHFASFCTYWDKLFAGKDNFWFSGFVVGAAICPVLFMDTGLWWMVLARAIILCLAWGSLNKWLPQRVLIWRRDVVEEFTRYAVSL
jgi:hypothetical protein